MLHKQNNDFYPYGTELMRYTCAFKLAKNFTSFQSLFSAAFLLLGCLPTASVSGKEAIRGNFVAEVSPAPSFAFDDDLVSASSLHFEAEVATFSFLRADVLDPLPVAGVCSSTCAFQ